MVSIPNDSSKANSKYKNVNWKSKRCRIDIFIKLNSKTKLSLQHVVLTW